MLCLIEKDQCELEGHGCDPIKLHTLTMQIMMTISDAITARKPTVFIVEEVWRNHLRGADKLRPVILAGSSYVECVGLMFSKRYSFRPG